MPVTRRGFLKLAGAASLGAAFLPVAPVSSSSGTNAENSASMLYDGTLCVGCRACQTACKRRAKLPYELDANEMYEAPVDLSAHTWTIIKVYAGEDGTTFIKNQCMHCIDPACVSVCPVAALEKTAAGPVIYHGDRCIGCRYCMAACPFNVPKTEWEKALPLIQKCDFCADHQAKGEQPECSAACPTGALIFGTRKQMLDTAHARLETNKPYYQHVYGEKEAGGTSMLYISALDYRQLGFKEMSDVALPTIDWPYMQAVPAVVAVMISLSTGIYLWTHRKEHKQAPKKEA